MMRATGFLLGTLLVLAIFLFVSGDGTAPSPLQAPVSRAAAVPPTTEPAPAERVEPSNAETAAVDEESLLEVTSSGLELDPQTWNASLAAYEAVSDNEAVAGDTTKTSRYRLWSPFRSEWAAQGFAQRLTLATDVPVEVVNEGPGNYQVVFSYRDELERQALVEHIETVTGLELE